MSKHLLNAATCMMALCVIGCIPKEKNKEQEQEAVQEQQNVQSKDVKVEKKLTGKQQIADFVDNTKKYKGETITLLLRYNGKDPLRDGGFPALCPFETADAEAGSSGIFQKLTIIVPASLDDIPNATGGTRLWVTFVCEDGEFMRGNKATKIKRE